MSFEQWCETEFGIATIRHAQGGELSEAGAREILARAWNAALIAVRGRFDFDLSKREVDCLTGSDLINPLRTDSQRQVTELEP